MATPGDDTQKKKKKRPDLPVVPIKSTADYQRMKLERLMANPNKPAFIPEPPKNKDLPPPPEFVRNIMGSSAGAGSGEFHVYRHIRRKEYARQKYIQEKAQLDEKQTEFEKSIEDKQKALEQKTAKKRAKRLKKKQKQKAAKKQKPNNPSNAEDNGSSSESDSEEDQDEKSGEDSKPPDTNE